MMGLIKLSLLVIWLSACQEAKFDAKKNSEDPASNASPGAGDGTGAPETDGTNDSDTFGGSPEDKEIIYVPGINPLNVDAPIPFYDNKGLRFDGGGIREVAGETKKVPVEVLMALDVTFSMDYVIETMKTSVQDFAQKLFDAGLDSRFGVLAFRDDIVGKYPLSTDLAGLRQFVSTLSAVEGGDPHEAALKAVKVAIEEALTIAKKDAIIAVLVVTDNPGHMGPASSDCRASGLVDYLNGLPADVQNRIRIYNSTGPSPGGVFDCAPYRTANQQWADIIKNTLNAGGKKGSELSSPFNPDVLVNEFAKKIEISQPGKQEVCLARKATLTVNGTQVGTWESPGDDQVYASFLNKTPVHWKEAYSQLTKDQAGGSDAVLNISRCCFESSSLTNGDFSSCQETNQSVNYVYK